MTENDQPSQELESGATPISDLLISERHDRHEPHQEVGAAPQMAPQEPQPSAQPAPTAETAAPAPAPAQQPAQAGDQPENQGPKWYRDAIQKANREREQLRRENEALRRQGQPQSDQGRPDPVESPEDFNGYIEARFERQRLVDRLERSEERFIDKHDEDTFEEVRSWLSTRPDIEEWAIKQRDPWRAAHSQFTKERLADEIGEDPNAWREKERERLRQEILAEQEAARAADTQHIPAPAPQMRSAPPPPASAARSATPRDSSGRFAGPTPLGDLTKHKFR